MLLKKYKIRNDLNKKSEREETKKNQSKVCFLFAVNLPLKFEKVPKKVSISLRPIGKDIAVVDLVGPKNSKFI